MTGDDLDDLFGTPDDATPLTAEECEGLIPSDLAYRRDLNWAEQLNILQAQEWALARRRDLLTEKFLKDLHRQMLGDVWRWAGRFRTTERNIGIRFYEIPMAVRTLCEDVRAWIEHGAYPPDEIAVRLHHRLVQIHPFPNGNGRHSRLMADLLIMQMGQQRFTWGRANLQDPSEVRRRYIDALRAADDHDVRPIVEFARS